MKFLTNNTINMYIEESLYKKIMETSVIVTVDIIFINKNKEILLWLRNNAPLKNTYYIPWGRIYKYENIIDAAKRESKKELWISLKIEKIKFLWVYDDIYKEDAFFEWMWSHFASRTYIYNLDDNEKVEINDNQHAKIKFFNINDISLHPFIRDRIIDMKRVNYI